MQELLVVIPARWGSSRFPGKILTPIFGRPMILHTYERCAEAVPLSSILVATDDERIAGVCRSAEIRVEMTREHATGTDRVAEIAERFPARTYLNIQGDEPLFNPADIKTLVAAARVHPRAVVIGCCPITNEQDWHSPNCCKLVFGDGQRLVYISRAPVPGSKTNQLGTAYRQVCGHAFPGAALAAFARRGRTPLELQEDHEMLRFLEIGWPVIVEPMSGWSIPVDRPDHVAKVEAALREREAWQHYQTPTA